MRCAQCGRNDRQQQLKSRNCRTNGRDEDLRCIRSFFEYSQGVETTRSYWVCVMHLEVLTRSERVRLQYMRVDTCNLGTYWYTFLPSLFLEVLTRSEHVRLQCLRVDTCNLGAYWYTFLPSFFLEVLTRSERVRLQCMRVDTCNLGAYWYTFLPSFF